MGKSNLNPHYRGGKEIKGKKKKKKNPNSNPNRSNWWEMKF